MQTLQNKFEALCQRLDAHEIDSFEYALELKDLLEAAKVREYLHGDAGGIQDILQDAFDDVSDLLEE